jgi:CheY-like chemotaxis protein
VATPADLDLPEIEAGRFMEMSVSDSGHGIQQRLLSRIFEPFFTTKNVGEGTGMGLSVVHGIVKSHGGAIKVFSQPDRGATFKIYLPLIPDRAAENEVLLPAMTGGDERILMVDDEAALVDVGGKMLRRLGYQVTAHIDGEAALRDFAQSPEAFDLVITDQTMPHLTGAELAERFRAVRADVPVVLCTGYNQHLNAASARDLGFDAFLLKPIILNDMARVIRAVLDEKWLRSSSD